ncbi:MAG: radical SAM protein, partial [Anaerolineae bacterium]|nr:radical SAM protein [Anaerolineae bacterium]
TCTWCSHSVFGETHRRRSVEDVVNEVAWLAEHYRPDQLWYADDVFTINRRWFLQYAAALKARGLRIPFECISRADRIDEAVADALAEMGCYRLWIGAESGSQRILDAMKRKADIADVQAKTKLLQARGIQVGMFIMLGYDGEDVSDIEATVDHLKKSNPDVFLTTVAYPIKGTKYHEAVDDRVYSGLHWEQRTDRDLGV